MLHAIKIIKISSNPHHLFSWPIISFRRFQIYLWNSITEYEWTPQTTSHRRKPEPNAKFSNCENDLSLPPEHSVSISMSIPNILLEEKSPLFGFVGVIKSTMITFPFSGRLFQQFFRSFIQSSSDQSCSIHYQQINNIILEILDYQTQRYQVLYSYI